MLALDTPHMPLPPLGLLFDSHWLTFDAHDQRSADEESVIDIRVLSLSNVWDEMRCMNARKGARQGSVGLGH